MAVVRTAGGMRGPTRPQGIADRGFFELAWSIFRACMKGIFVVVSALYVFCTIVMFLGSGEILRMGLSEAIITLTTTIFMGLFVVSYVTLLIAIPVSALCALLAFVLTLVGRVADMVFPGPGGVARSWNGFPTVVPPPPDPRIQVVETRIVQGEAICPVCAAAIGAEHVSCAKCEAPHHPECWDYNGSCAVFGCGGVDSVASDGHDRCGPKALPESGCAN